MKNLNGRLAKLEGQPQAGVAGRPYDRFWAAVAGIPQDPPLRPEEYPCGLYESLVKSARDGQQGIDVVERRIEDALKRSLKDQQQVSPQTGN